jgi:hypothetical protein
MARGCDSGRTVQFAVPDSRISPDVRFLDARPKPLQSLRRNDALDLRTVCKAEPEKPPLLWRRQSTLTVCRQIADRHAVSHKKGLDVFRPSGGANAVAGC